VTDRERVVKRRKQLTRTIMKNHPISTRVKNVRRLWPFLVNDKIDVTRVYRYRNIFIIRLGENIYIYVRQDSVALFALNGFVLLKSKFEFNILLLLFFFFYVVYARRRFLEGAYEGAFIHAISNERRQMRSGRDDKWKSDFRLKNTLNVPPVGRQ